MPSQESQKMSQVCKQVSIESPSVDSKQCVFSFDVPVPEVPPTGARIRVECAGACYRPRKNPFLVGSSADSSLTSVTSTASLTGDVSTAVFGSTETGNESTQSPSHHGVRDAALYPGYEVAGIIDCLGEQIDTKVPLAVGDKVIVYPYEGIPHRYAEYITVPEISCLVKVPDNMALSVAAMLPTGALWALNTVHVVKQHITRILQERNDNSRVKVLVVGTGGLALWVLLLAQYYFKDIKDKVLLAVASLRDEGMLLVKEAEGIKVVQWNEECYENILIERTKNSCEGEVDFVIDFGTTSRSLHRSLQCVNKGGMVFISSDVSERLLPKFSKRAEEKEITIKPVNVGSIEQLRELVSLVASEQVKPPPHTVFPANEAPEVIRKLCNSEICGRAILKFHP